MVHLKRYRGRGITDYIPGYSYLPSLSGAKQAVEVAKEAYNIHKDLNSDLPPELPPLPGHLKGAPLRAGVKDRSFEDPNFVGSREPKTYSSLGPLITQLKKYQPITKIDNALKSLGYRDKVRNFLSKHPIGQALIGAADYGLKKGFGRKKINRRKPRRKPVILLRLRK